MKDKFSIRKYPLFLILLLSGFTLNSIAEEREISIVTPLNTYECWVVGNFNNWKITSALKCTKSDNYRFKIVLNDSNWTANVNWSNLEYKYVKCNCDWACAEKGKLGEEVPNRTYRSGITDTIAKWSYFSESTMLFIYVKTPPGTEKCFLIGDLNGWDEPNEMGEMIQTGKDDKDSVIFRNAYSLYATICRNYKYRFCCGPSLEYVQAIPDYSFETDKTVFPSIIAWKKEYRTDLILPAKSDVKVHVADNNLIIEGLTGNENIFITDITGKFHSILKGNGESKKIITLKKGCYLLKLNSGIIRILI